MKINIIEFISKTSRAYFKDDSLEKENLLLSESKPTSDSSLVYKQSDSV
jgi:hypothetical protein